MYYPKFHEELLKLKDFLCYFRSYNVFKFHSGFKNVRLVNTPLTNSCTIKSKYKIRGKPTRILIRLKI